MPIETHCPTGSTGGVELRAEWHDDVVDRSVVQAFYFGSDRDQEPISNYVREDVQNQVIESS